MLYLENHWFIGNREVTVASITIKEDTHPRAEELLTHLSNWPDTNDLGIDIDSSIDTDDNKIWTVTGPITNIVIFLYNWILDYKNYTFSDILKDKDFNINTEIYLKNVR